MIGKGSPNRPKLRLTLRGKLTLCIGCVLFMIAYPLARRELLVVAVFALLLSLGGMLIVRFRRSTLSVIRLFSPSVVSAETHARVRLQVRNRSRMPTPSLVLSDSFAWPPMRSSHVVTSIGTAKHATTTIDYQIRPPRRGVYPIGPLVVTSTDPFGMARIKTTVGQTDRLTVVPALSELGFAAKTLVDGDGVSKLIQRLSGNDDDLTTREYRAGDALRRVHWRASARHGELMVRQEEHRSRPEAHIVIDTRAAGYPDADSSGTSERFEWAVRMLASLALHLDQSGLRVRVSETAGAQVEPLGENFAGGQHSWAFLLSLASVQLRDSALQLNQSPSQDAGLLFALLATPEPEVIDWVIRRRNPGQQATLFSLGMSEHTKERFQKSSWRCVSVAEDESVWDAWQKSVRGVRYVDNHR